MRAVLINVSDAIVEERRRLGLDRQDEMWDGEWHLVNPPKFWHPALNADLLFVLWPIARARGLRPLGDSTGIFENIERNWRIPDQCYARHDQIIEEGLVGAELVVELRSPGDDSYLKLPFYADRGITEALIVHEDRRFELYRLDDGDYKPVEDGVSEVLGVTFSTVEGPQLRITWGGGEAEV